MRLFLNCPVSVVLGLAFLVSGEIFFLFADWISFFFFFVSVVVGVAFLVSRVIFFFEYIW